MTRAVRRLLGVAATSVLALATVVGATATLPSAASAATLVPPSGDSFYSYGKPLGAVAPGTVLRTRTVRMALGDKLPLLSATQVLYRTTNQRGGATATVATIMKPVLPLGKIKLVSYQTAYDGVSSTCRPSFQLRGGTPTSATLQAENLLITGYLLQGFTVVTSDYEGPTDDFGAGREEARNTLDGIRAAQHVLHLAASVPVGLVGYSGGSIASMWASQVAPSYAPELHIVGVAAGGIPADFAHNLPYIDGSKGWAGALPAIGIGLARAYHLHLDDYLSARGLQVKRVTVQGCLDPGGFPGLTFAQMLKPQYRNWRQVPVFVRMFNESIMGRGNTPREPLMMSVGNADGTGDGVMIAKDDQQLAHTYCQRGVRVQFHISKGLDHTEAAIPFMLSAMSWIHARFAGALAPTNCASIAPGNPLTPLPRP